MNEKLCDRILDNANSSIVTSVETAFGALSEEGNE
jgi:hypothetical protein